ncbi:MAG: Hsp20/alpha crystallin family protein [Nitrospirae bacterium]|nr:Hsp20/alpha crystallin family protein [Nitrospirota bacterium]
MSLVKWGPLKELEEMRRDMDRLFDEFFSPGPRRRRTWGEKPEEGTIVPNVEIYDRTNEIVLRAELPGVKKEDIDLSISKDSVTLKGQLKKDEDVKPEAYYLSEIGYGSFARSVGLPVEVDSEKAKASLKNGFLELVLPKREESKPKEIRIEVS